MARTEEAFFEEVADQNLYPLWKLSEGAPPPKLEPHIWRWQTMERLSREAGDLESLKGQGERRALVMSNPGLKGPFGGATKTLSAAIQIVWPGEIAVAHRHTPAAVRFIIQGNGAYTVQDGESFIMEQGDFTLTPSMVYHDHGNLTDEPMIWLDCLDAPLVGYLDAVHFEPFPEDEQPVTKPNGYTSMRVGSGMMRGLADKPSPLRPLPVTYKWMDSYGALVGLDEATPFDGVAMEYINPVTGGHAMPTASSVLQRLRPGEHTRAHRHTSSTVYHVAQGDGFSVIDSKRVTWSKGDTFVLPSWVWHEHGNDDSSNDAVLFSMSDLPIIEAAGLYREEHGQHQEVTGELG